MALIHIREAVATTIVTTYTVQVRYETYDTLTDPCTFAQSDLSKILAAAGLPSTLTWSSCTVVSTSVVGRINRYVLDIVVTG